MSRCKWCDLEDGMHAMTCPGVAYLLEPPTGPKPLPPPDALSLADDLAEAVETMAIEIERREIPFDLPPPIRGVIEAAKRYRTARGTR